MIRTRNVKAQNERIETGVLAKSQKKDEKVSVDRKVGECYQCVHATETVLKRRLLQFQPRILSSKSTIVLFSPAPKAQIQTEEKTIEWCKHQRRESFLIKKAGERAKKSSQGSPRNS